MITFPCHENSEDQALLSKAAEVPHLPQLQDCSRHALSHFARSEGLDLATALLYDRILRDPLHQAFLHQVQNTTVQPCALPRVGIVPGAFYRHHNNTGADGQKVIRILNGLGCPVEVIPIESFGSLTTNARIILRWLRQHERESVALISLSKGSCDTKIALGEPDSATAFRHVVAWISLSGLPLGTPLVAWLNRQPLRRLAVALMLWWRRQSYSVIHELSDAPHAPLSQRPIIPSDLKVVQVVGTPLRRHLTHPWASKCYERLSPLGPNDGGGFLLADIAQLPGLTLPLWGADHYLQPPWDIVTPLRKLFQIVLTSPR